MKPWKSKSPPGCSRSLAAASAGRRSLPAAAPALLVALAATPAGTHAQLTDTVSLDDALELALLSSPQLAQSNAGLINAGSTRQRAWGSFLPNLSMSSGASVQSSQRFDAATQRVVSGSSNSYNAGLSASYQVFQGGRKFHELDRTASALREAEARLETQRFSVLLQTRTAYLNALRQADLVRIAEANMARAEETLEITRVRVSARDATPSDTLRTRLQMANASQALLQARNNLRSARFALGRQIGRGGPVVPAPPSEGLEPAPLRLSEGEILALAELASPAVRSAQAALAVAGTAVTNARSSYLPSLSMSSGYSWANQERTLTGGNTSWSLRFSGSYQLFDGFQRETGLSQASQNRRVARLTEEDARRGVRQDVDGALRTLETQTEAIGIARVAVAVALEDLRIIQARYAASAVTILDVLVSQDAVAQAEADLVSALYDYVVAKAQLESIIGVEL